MDIRKQFSAVAACVLHTGHVSVMSLHVCVGSLWILLMEDLWWEGHRELARCRQGSWLGFLDKLPQASKGKKGRG